MSSTKGGNKTEGFHGRVLRIVKAIPKGKVLTYGQVATLAGAPRASRIVGGVLYGTGPGSKVPWQRVVNRKGGISTFRIGFGEIQIKLLKREGVRFSRDQTLDLSRYQYWPSRVRIQQWELPDHLIAQIQERWKI